MTASLQLSAGVRSVPYWRLSAFYFYYFGLLGALMPFLGLYLQQQGFSLSEIGQLTAILMGTKLLAPNLWGWLADHTGQRMQVIRLGSVLSVLIFAGMFLRPGYWGVALILGGFSFFWNAILPQFEVVTLRHLRDHSDQYSRIRLWGSVGFVVSVVGLGWIFEHQSIEILPFILITLLGLISLSSFVVTSSEMAVSRKGSLANFFKQLKSPQVLLFFTICLLLQISHGPYYTFFSIFLEEYGYSKTAIGWLWALGVFAEIGVFLVAHLLFSWVNVRTLAVSCLIIAAIRWYLIGAYPQSLPLLLLAQLGHAATFGVFHAIAIYLIHRYFNAQASGQGQAMYSAFSFGVGGALGAYLSGMIVENWGGSVAYFTAGASALIAGVLALGLRTPDNAQSGNATNLSSESS